MTQNFEIRPAVLRDATAIAEVQVSSWKTTYKGIVPDGLIERMTVPERTGGWTRILSALEESGQGKVFLCETEGEVVGFASFGPQRDHGLEDRGFTSELTAIYLLETAQRQGIGSALLQACATEALGLGHNGMSVWVLEQNLGARGFYEARGGESLAAQESDDRKAPVDEVAYGWRDLSSLISTAAL